MSQREDRPAASQAGGVQRLVSHDDHGLARQCIPPDAMQYWLDQGWADHGIRHWHSLCHFERNDRGKIVRFERNGTSRRPS
eukprot:3581114-Pyramimonas_sp.AAC.1